jgi:hypothetical protein
VIDLRLTPHFCEGYFFAQLLVLVSDQKVVCDQYAPSFGACRLVISNESIQIDLNRFKCLRMQLMEAETTDFIEVERFDSDTEYPLDSQIDSLEVELIHWLSPDEARHLCRLDKSAMQRGMADLINAHGIPVDLLRRGQARRTEYSHLAVDLLRALNTRNEAVFLELKSKVMASPSVGSGAIVSVVEHFEIAATATSRAMENRQLIHQEMATVLTRFDALADAIGDKIIARMDERITEKVRLGIKRIGES